MASKPLGRNLHDIARMTPADHAKKQFNADLAGVLDEMKASRGMSRTDVAHATGLSRSSIDRIAAGSSDLQLDTLFKFLTPLERSLAIVPANGGGGAPSVEE